MELQELMERIQRWRARQGGAAVEAEQQAYREPAQPYAEPAEYAAQVENGEEQISELDVEPDAVVSEEATSDLNVEQIEEVD